jgi:hypothetical protein
MFNKLYFTIKAPFGKNSNHRARPSMVLLIKTVYANFSVPLFLYYCGGTYFERQNPHSAPRIPFSLHTTQYFNEYFLL